MEYKIKFQTWMSITNLTFTFLISLHKHTEVWNRVVVSKQLGVLAAFMLYIR